MLPNYWSKKTTTGNTYSFRNLVRPTSVWIKPVQFAAACNEPDHRYGEPLDEIISTQEF